MSLLTLSAVHDALCTVHEALCTMHHARCTKPCARCTMHGALPLGARSPTHQLSTVPSSSGAFNGFLRKRFPDWKRRGGCRCHIQAGVVSARGRTANLALTAGHPGMEAQGKFGGHVRSDTRHWRRQMRQVTSVGTRLHTTYIRSPWWLLMHTHVPQAPPSDRTFVPLPTPRPQRLDDHQ